MRLFLHYGEIASCSVGNRKDNIPLGHPNQGVFFYIYPRGQKPAVFASDIDSPYDFFGFRALAFLCRIPEWVVQEGDKGQIKAYSN
jgi:hypothetical protein